MLRPGLWGRSDADHTGSSVIEVGDDQREADARGGALLSSYVWPTSPEARAADASAQMVGVQPPGRAIDFFSRKVSSPSGPNSRPMPDSL